MVPPGAVAATDSGRCRFALGRPKRLAAAIIACALVAAAASGCGAAAQLATLAQPSWAHVALTFLPDPPVARRYETVTVRLVNAEGQPIPDARVAWSANMIGMNHPASATLQARSGGIYSGRTLFVMGGEWLATVRVSAGSRSATVHVRFAVLD